MGAALSSIYRFSSGLLSRVVPLFRESEQLAPLCFLKSPPLSSLWDQARWGREPPHPWLRARVVSPVCAHLY